MYSDKAVWALGNIAGDYPAYRDLAIGHGALNQVLAQFNRSSSMPMIRAGTWALSNFCSGKPQPQFDMVSRKNPFSHSFFLFCIYWECLLLNGKHFLFPYHRILVMAFR